MTTPGTFPTDAEQPIRRWGIGRILRIVFVLAGFSFLAIVVARALRRSEGLDLPSWPRVGLGFLLAVATLGFLFWGWRALIPDAHGPRLAATFYLSQLGKYIPGAVWQVVAQAGLSTQAGVGWARAATYVPVHAVAQAAAGGTIGGIVGLVHPDLAWPLRLVAIASFGLVLALNRRVAIFAIALVARVIRRDIDPETALPSHEATLRSYVRQLGSTAANSALFAVLFSGVISGLSAGDLATVFAGFALAWTAGYVIVPLPTGVGAREAVLLLVLSTFAEIEDIVTISVVHRLVSIAAEVTMIGSSSVFARMAGSSTD